MPTLPCTQDYSSMPSPRHESPRKRRKLDARREPLRDVPSNVSRTTLGGLELDDSDGEEDIIVRPAPKHDTLPKSSEHDTTLKKHCNIRLEENEEFQDIDRIHGANDIREEAVREDADMIPPSSSVPACTTWAKARSSSGRTHYLRPRRRESQKTYEELIATRSKTDAGRAQKSYYGIDVHALVEEAKLGTTASKELAKTPLIPEGPVVKSIETAEPAKKTLLWTEKYRARKFTDLVGDERTHRSVLRWLKAWDPIVFPGASKFKVKPRFDPQGETAQAERQHRNVLLLTGPPGLGKTTLAHVCAKQAGYEVQEINASDERSRDVVKGRIRDMVGTENVRQVDRSMSGKAKKASRPVCVVVDEVDGVVSGNSASGGDGGFIKALSDLLALDQKNSSGAARQAATEIRRGRKKGDNFRLLRPLILICNDVYHPSLRLLRTGTMAEVIYVRKPPLNMVVPRIQTIFEREGIPCDSDGVRQLCEASWGVSSRKEDKASGGVNEGDIRGILVIAEWVASKLRTTVATNASIDLRLTKRWVESNILLDLSQGGGASRSIGRGGSKEVVDRIFAHNAGFPLNTLASSKHASAAKASTYLTPAASAAESAKTKTTALLRTLIESASEDERIVSDLFSAYASLPFQDDTFLTKPNAGNEWLHFYDALSSRVYGSQEWELGQYLSTPALGFHALFAGTSRHSYATNATGAGYGKDFDETENKQKDLPFTGPRASFHAHETQRANTATIQHFHSRLSIPLARSFRSPEALSTELLPYLLRCLNPDVKPVVVGGSDRGVASVRRGSEKEMVRRAVDGMIASGVTFERARVEFGESSMGGAAGAQGQGGWVYRMEPGLDALGTFETAERAGTGAEGKVRYAVRQVLEQEYKREVVRREQEARVRRMRGLDADAEVDEGMLAVPIDGGKYAKSGTKDEKVQQAKTAVKRDFFGRPIVAVDTAGNGIASGGEGELSKDSRRGSAKGGRDERRVWVTYHEGYSNAVRKGITMKELMSGL